MPASWVQEHCSRNNVRKHWPGLIPNALSAISNLSWILARHVIDPSDVCHLNVNSKDMRKIIVPLKLQAAAFYVYGHERWGDFQKKLETFGSNSMFGIKLNFSFANLEDLICQKLWVVLNSINVLAYPECKAVRILKRLESQSVYQTCLGDPSTFVSGARCFWRGNVYQCIFQTNSSQHLPNIQ